MAYPATAIDCKKPPTGYTGEFSQIKAVDRLTVEFDMCAPDVSFLSKIAFATNGILDSDWLAAHAKDKSYVKTTNGTGPYMVKEWVSGDHITMVANPNYGTSHRADLIFQGRHGRRLQDLRPAPSTAWTTSAVISTRPADSPWPSKRRVQHSISAMSAMRRGTGLPCDRLGHRPERISTCSTPGSRYDYHPVLAGGCGRRVVRHKRAIANRSHELRLHQDLRPVLPPEGSPVPNPPDTQESRPVQGSGDPTQDPPGGQRHLPEAEQGPPFLLGR
jgi:hypothetical protein